ncbi:replication initiation protein [Agrobacterium sp. TS43]|uniref:plasmid replication protein RepC n=1 Tax=Agrobacterium TaxID=357 RepID=UPI000377EA77|nr:MULTISPECIES: plasmid replication protein RepC [Agrobacterium]EPR21197.1 replication initiation protein [Agrobacterium radiobacter DSM 30147]KDR90798.1 replication initiation protein RepC [Agrobacterium tumefaciens GW4]KVK50018.1 replication initiation protein [Agrobacterium sp. JL28]KVK50308.1 replication initiation protein [Agrobacterium sp. LY4]KVK59353.1 replication initiation protein [Agrobacterium sp. TS43]
MQTSSVTTPFGPRPMTLALVRRQTAIAEIEVGKSVDKWKVLRDVSAAIDLLGVQSNSLAVLDALLTFYPENELRQEAQLIVFPSNAQLCLRAHAMAGATLRRHIAILVEAGLILRKDSANGKRYARKDGNGQIESAYGFDLSPLLARSEELAQLAQQVAADRAALRKAKESLTVCRRDVRKLVTAAMEEGAVGDWPAIEDAYVRLVGGIPRNPSLADVSDILDEMVLLREEVINRLEFQEISKNPSSNDAHIEQHIQNSNTNSLIEFEPSSEKEQGAKPSKTNQQSRMPIVGFPLGMVLKACPTIADYGPGGSICSWRDLMAAAVTVRSMLGVSPSAYEDACSAMGPENAAVAIAGILERANFINSAGGYLRDLTRRTKRGEFSLGPMIIALLKANGEAQLRA